ncbi:GntR family transcriptional regulator [Roseibium alexandrii]|uniref:Colanic acid/biofilm transcriptional regulator n=1 Tax=Roseibium alexandrii TaxID=388408 RepID=A0A0M7AK65_9HYPH|nr:GntR family transcriptional regulator [Roseibium alexandrii]CTQ75518.1 colanic acid/biofilm transcriptional regulator [Roseibium alexandrii]
MSISEEKPTLTLEQVVQELELRIVLGRLRPKERLVEEELILELGVKRHIVRSAFLELERRHLVERRPNKGARVRDYSVDEVNALSAFRADLHRLAVSKIKFPISTKSLAELRRIARAYEMAVHDGDYAQAIASDNAFHTCLFELCENRFLTASIGEMSAAARPIDCFRIADPATLSRAVADHRQIIEAATRGNAGELAELCVNHVFASSDTYIREVLLHRHQSRKEGLGR